jgi:hypothetical protein
MIHAQIDLPADVYEDVERIARARKQSTSLVIRDLIDSGVASWRQGDAGSERHGLRQLAELGLKGPADLASRLDDYLYGEA